jgi:hypothetical protein
VTIVPKLKVGIFVSALISDVVDGSVWTASALDILLPAFENLLWSKFLHCWCDKRKILWMTFCNK